MTFRLETSEFPSFTAVAPPPPFQNDNVQGTMIQETRFENLKGFLPCTSLSLMQRRESMEAMRETIFRVAAMQPVDVEVEEAAPKRKNVKISTDPQSVAARHRRERISQRIRTLQRMVPGGSKMDTASMLDEAVHYMKFLKKQVQVLQQAAESNRRVTTNIACWNINSNAFNYANVN